MAALVCVLTGCSAASIREPAGESMNTKVWNSYEKKYVGISIQKNCGPQMIRPPTGVPIRGKVIALHGFTACPQQYFDWAKTLSKNGYVVQMMLLPGHGLRPHADGADDISQMPSGSSANAYYDFADEVIKIARADRLPTILTGVSTGGTIALQAAFKDPGAFEKLILFSPYFAASNLLYRNILPIGGRVPLLSAKIVSWGPSCLNEMSRGRAGVCTFRLHQLQSVQSFGKTIANTARSIYPKIQIVGVTGDKAASTEYIQIAAKKLGWSLDNNENVSVCLYKNGANHSLLSKYDSPDENKFWLSSMLKDSNNFIEDGKFFPTKGDSGEFGLPSCTLSK